ncbi:H(+)-transporting V0 sector ATPase subunit e [Puccinia graminis f. sp. tritici]|uniref:H(+)-transporting V0 sector ATPase subunit e n=1 Tax=Puccinia graminis f. sp. tritici TaxID=56615 RepID=A0A5B0QHT5_PUCGR|nr:H(+)-transporting V0 sector ATPase subunit e [Puccinia graminis f. sp. tritici]
MGGWLIFNRSHPRRRSLVSWDGCQLPKEMTKIVIRTAVIATITCCYLMWAIVYLAQLHPLIRLNLKRGDLRPNIDAAPQTKKPGSIISAANFHSSSSSITSCPLRSGRFQGIIDFKLDRIS